MKLALPAIKSTLIAITLALNAFSLNAHAALTSYTNAGADLVYSSVSDVTWTKDANLLGTWLASSADSDGNGTKDIIDSILKSAYSKIPDRYLPFITPLLNASSFAANGQVSWLGAMAFVDYLNDINYAGSNQWYLPTIANAGWGYNTPTNGTAKGDELVELFYQELGGAARRAIPNTPTFDNEQTLGYWSGTKLNLNFHAASGLHAVNGRQIYANLSYQLSAWAVSPGLITPVPEPDSVALLLAGLGLMAGVVRRKQKSFA